MHRSFAAAVAASLFGLCPEAFALAQRTFVSTGGADANTVAHCSLAAPCRSFGGAITVTATDGEIVVLDSGGYGRVTIDKSVSIIAPTGVYAGISVLFGDNGVVIDTPGVVVTLRGLTINGQGGAFGILFTQGGRLYIEQCTVSNNGLHGIVLLTGRTYITDTVVRGNGGNGIWAEGAINVIVDRTRIESNGNTGVRVLNGPSMTVTGSIISGNSGLGGFSIDGDDGVSETIVAISESSVSQHGAQGIIASTAAGGSTLRLAVTRSVISRNGATGVFLAAGSGSLVAVITDNTIFRNLGQGGIHATGAGINATIAANSIVGNSVNGVNQVASALLKTRNNNVVQNNANDVNGTLTFVAGD